MKRATFAAVACLALVGIKPAGAVVLGFDDVPPQNDFDGNTYHEWTFEEAGIWTSLWPAASVSGDNYITNFNSRVGKLSRATSFDFAGAWFTADGRYATCALTCGDPSNLSVRVEGLNDLGAAVFSSVIVLSTAPQFFTFDWANIYGIRWDPLGPDGGSNNVGIDDLTYDVVSVPEPATLSLLVLGLIGLGLARRARVL